MRQGFNINIVFPLLKTQHISGSSGCNAYGLGFFLVPD